MRRRLEMVADRIEACCAGYKITASWSWMRQHHGVVTLGFDTGGKDLRKLSDELTLSLGVPVTCWRDVVRLDRMP